MAARSSGPASTLDEEPAEMKVLRKQLKLDARTKPEMLAAAAALAAAQRGEAGPDQVKLLLDKVPPGSQGRAYALAKRIALQPAAAPEADQGLPGEALLLRSVWISTNAPSIWSISTDTLEIAADGQHATRIVRAHFAEGDAPRVDEVVYDLILRNGETAQNRDDRHRRREEACIRRLDESAATAHRARRAREQRERRADEAAVREVLDRTIGELERQAQQEERAERQRQRAERAETRRAKRKRRRRREELREVHPLDYDQIEVVDDALDFELEAEEALEDDTEIPEAELQPLPSDPIDRVLLLGLTPSQEQHTEILRRRYMKACSDYLARLSRYLPEYVDAFSLKNSDPALSYSRSGSYSSALNMALRGTPALRDPALDRDLRLLPFGSQGQSLERSPPPPPNERFWLTEVELSDPQLRAQRLQDILPHIEHMRLREQREQQVRMCR